MFHLKFLAMGNRQINILKTKLFGTVQQPLFFTLMKILYSFGMSLLLNSRF